MTLEDGPNFSDGKTPNAVEMQQLWDEHDRQVREFLIAQEEQNQEKMAKFGSSKEVLSLEAQIWEVEINRRNYGLDAPTQEEVDWVW